MKLLDDILHIVDVDTTTQESLDLFDLQKLLYHGTILLNASLTSLSENPSDIINFKLLIGLRQVGLV